MSVFINFTNIFIKKNLNETMLMPRLGDGLVLSNNEKKECSRIRKSLHWNLCWLGHLEGMKAVRRVRMVWKERLCSRRKRGRHRKSWWAMCWAICKRCVLERMEGPGGRQRCMEKDSTGSQGSLWVVELRKLSQLKKKWKFSTIKRISK